MILETKKFQEVCKVISLAVDSNSTAANLELITEENKLNLNVTNGEYYVCESFLLSEPETFDAVVDAKLFLNLISGLTTETFELKVKDNVLVVKANKSTYKLSLIWENNSLISLPKITLENKTVEMNVDNSILQSIVNVNGKELEKVKAINVNELNKLYYITEEGAFTFTTGACLNSFKLDKPIKILLNDRIVKLFKLFKNESIHLSFGHDEVNGQAQSKLVLQTEDTYLAAIITLDDRLFSRIVAPFNATKQYIKSNYAHTVVLSVPALRAAISRLLSFSKNSLSSFDNMKVPVTINFNNNDFNITDSLDNTETISIENGSFVATNYEMKVNLIDIKLVIDSCVCDHITLNCGDNRSIIVTRGNVYNLIPEMSR